MKLASLKAGRDGRLHLVSHDLAQAVDAGGIVPTMQAALDDWHAVAGALGALSDQLNRGEAPGAFPFDPACCAAPLPRAFQWADGSAYVGHVELVRKARGAEMPARFWSDPLIYQGGSDGFLGPRDPIPLADESWGCDFEAEVAIVTDDVAQGSDETVAAQAIRLVMLGNDVSLRALVPGELEKGFGFFQSKPATAFSPVAVTPDELGTAWDGRKLSRPLRSHLNGKLFGCPEAGSDMTFDFPTLIAHAAKTRALGAGSIVGSGTVSNLAPGGGPSLPLVLGGVGYSCIAEARMAEKMREGAPKTPFLRVGDSLRIDMEDAAGVSIFGAIEQRVVAYPAD